MPRKAATPGTDRLSSMDWFTGRDSTPVATSEMAATARGQAERVNRAGGEVSKRLPLKLCRLLCQRGGASQLRKNNTWCAGAGWMHFASKLLQCSRRLQLQAAELSSVSPVSAMPGMSHSK